MFLIVKKVKITLIFLYSCKKHFNIDYLTPYFSDFFKKDGLDICLAKIRFPDKNNLFACLAMANSAISSCIKMVQT